PPSRGAADLVVVTTPLGRRCQLPDLARKKSSSGLSPLSPDCTGRWHVGHCTFIVNNRRTRSGLRKTRRFLHRATGSANVYVLSSAARRAPHSLDYPVGMEGRNPLFARTGQQKSQPRNPGVRKKGNDDTDLPQTHSLSAHQEGRKFTPRAGGHGRR